MFPNCPCSKGDDRIKPILVLTIFFEGPFETSPSTLVSPLAHHSSKETSSGCGGLAGCSRLNENSHAKTHKVSRWFIISA
jgi:hypothetical protein